MRRKTGADTVGRISAQDDTYEQGLAAIDAEEYSKALELLQRASEEGHAQAQYRLGIMYANAEGVPLDFVAAAAWLRRAADKGLAQAQSILAWLYASGYGVEQDDQEAGRLYREAAQQGLPKDQYTLAAMYRWGRFGVDRNPAEMVRWYERAASQGFAPAQFALGQMLAKGTDVPRDNITAFQWLSLAIVNGSESAQKALMELTQQMAPAEIEAAKEQMMATARDHGHTLPEGERHVGHVY
ncbi:MAG: tetratricopeptide repeat protein [Gammaproteobacteria bacterium]|nr:tetratricopeptide repeat protein [Gammaproteobacteria bacterium]